MLLSLMVHPLCKDYFAVHGVPVELTIVPGPEPHARYFTSSSNCSHAKISSASDSWVNIGGFLLRVWVISECTNFRKSKSNSHTKLCNHL